MRKELVICDKKYVPAEFTFENVVAIEDMGINPFNLGGKPLKATASYVAITVGCDINEALKMIDKHIKAGGNLGDISLAMREALDESDFFQAMLGKKPTTEKA